jgi:hypothetical protein
MHPNPLGSTVFLTDHTGAPLQKALYGPYGELFASAGTLRDNRFASMQERDAVRLRSPP